MAATEFTFGIRGWFAWKPGLESKAAWLAWAGLPASDESEIKDNNPIPLPMMLRRRLNAFGQKVIGASLATSAADQSRYVFATRHGEFTTTLRILEDLHQRVAPSPADFTMSVHHALAGLLSIKTGNKAGHTTISAGTETFAYGLLEAATTVMEQQPSTALLVSYDEPLPDAYRNFRGAAEAELPLVIALEIVDPAAADHRFTLSIGAREAVAAGRPLDSQLGDQDGDEGGSENVPMGQRFLDFFLSGRSEARFTGETMTWIWRRVD
jgi:hypothetical protein